MISPYSYWMKLQNDFVCGNGKVEKLLTSLVVKKNYIVHYKTLKLYIELDMALMAIHRVIVHTERMVKTFYRI